MDTCKESTEELWRFSFSWVGCAWSTSERHLLIPCWNSDRNEEETEQQNTSNTFLLKHPAAETMRPGSTRILSWIKGIKSQCTTRCCLSAWVNVDEPKYSGVVKTPWLLGVRTVPHLSSRICTRGTEELSSLPSAPSTQPQPDNSTNTCDLHPL